jgi:hypothetical protein
MLYWLVIVKKLTRFFVLVALVSISAAGSPLCAEVILGDPPPAPTDLSGLPGGGPHPRIVTGGFNVDTSSREQVREFYNAVYSSSTGIPINSTAVTTSCFPGTNSTAFIDATLVRINWYRAMAGMPAAVTFDATESAKDQAAAVMMSEQGALQHVGSWTGWTCFSSDGTNASANSNLALGNNGPDAIDAYILDNGANNYEVGHRRWILYPQTQIMGTGDVPPENTYYSANATWVFDANYGGPRPATRTPYVSWPPAGYVPYQVVFPQWSFALSNANLSAATVTMSSNGVAVPVTLQSYATGYGENTLVWYPSSVNPSTATAFPFGGTDTVYSVTVSNVVTSAGTKSFTYNVTLFDPATTGPGYSPLLISGTSQPSVNVANAYGCTPATNPNTTGYQWVASQMTNGNLVDNALNGLTNFTISPAPGYSIVTAPPTGSGECFHLCHVNPVPQLLQLNELLFPSSSTTISFKSLLGYASSDEVARVQISTDGGGTWQDLFTEAGSNGAGESSFTQHTLSLANYAGESAQLRFDYDFSTGSYYPQTNSYVGWCLENIIVTNSQQLLSQITNSTSSTNFVFTPAQTGNYLLQARGVIFNQFSTDFGVAKSVTAVVGQPIIMMNSLVLSGSQTKINFTLVSGSASSFHLLQSGQPGAAWATNGSAKLTTNVPGSSYQFTTTNGPAMRFYRVVTP